MARSRDGGLDMIRHINEETNEVIVDFDSYQELLDRFNSSLDREERTRQEADRYRDRIVEYELAQEWQTGCTNCAKHMDKSYAAYCEEAVEDERKAKAMAEENLTKIYTAVSKLLNADTLNDMRKSFEQLEKMYVFDFLKYKEGKDPLYDPEQIVENCMYLAEIELKGRIKSNSETNEKE